MINYLDYTYQSNKGQVAKDQVFNSALHGSFSDKDYTSAFVNGEKYVSENGGETTVQLAWTPVNINKDIVVKKNGTTLVKGTDYTDVTVDGQITGLTALSANDEIVTEYYFLNEEVRSNGFGAFGTNGETANDGAIGGAGFTNVPEIGLKMNTLPVEAVARTLRAYWAFDAKLVA